MERPVAVPRRSLLLNKSNVVSYPSIAPKPKPRLLNFIPNNNNSTTDLSSESPVPKPRHLLKRKKPSITEEFRSRLSQQLSRYSRSFYGQKSNISGDGETSRDNFGEHSQQNPETSNEDNISRIKLPDHSNRLTGTIPHANSEDDDIDLYYTDEGIDSDDDDNNGQAFPTSSTTYYNQSKRRRVDSNFSSSNLKCCIL